MQPVPPPADRSSRRPADAALTRLHWVLTAILVAAWALVLATFATRLAVPGDPTWPQAMLLGLATVSTIVALSRRLPLQNVLLAVFVIAVLGGAAHALGANYEIPFGPFTFSDRLGWKLFKAVPATMLLIWVVWLLNSRGVARLILRPWRKTRAYGFNVIGLTVLLTVLLDLAFEPFAARVEHYWLWMPTKFPVTWEGTPLTNFIGWAGVTLLILAFATPALISKRQSRRAGPDFHPLGVWLGAMILFGVVAARHQLWPAAATDAGVALVVTVLAVRGGWW